ncbi:MAG: YbhB/YbcL family Raf kinase inhibitor-like protein [Candidatus Jordarchaeum sp.]|uniref:YbhB/YbcL family Raf kinase inhibitor-like protein n=1 Tax=Candidatus Jordarchaeum sp. TaxID=2823881 RepID=UPI004049A963
MKLKSKDFEHEGMIPSQFTCDGPDISPQLEWSEAPKETKSFALIVDDPDAPVGLWVHWLVCDIPPKVNNIPRNSLPRNARQVKNDFGKVEYGGPCPPSGTHRYFFKLYALKVEKLEGVNDKKSFYKKVEENKIAEAVLMGRYKRK